MSGVSIRLENSAAFSATIQRLADAVGRTAIEVLPAQMRLLAVDLAFNTRPIGKSASGKKSLEDKIEGRIRLIYLSVDAAAGMLGGISGGRDAAIFRSMMGRRKYAQASAFLNSKVSSHYNVGSFDGGTLHKSQKHSARVNAKMVVTDYPKVERYIRDVKKRAGFAKGGFATAAKQLGGTRGIPGYATRQRGAPGAGVISGSYAARNVGVTMTNGVPYIAQALDRAGEERALARRKRAVELVLERIATRRLRGSM